MNMHLFCMTIIQYNFLFMKQLSTHILFFTFLTVVVGFTYHVHAQVINTVAGTAIPGFNGNNIAATSAQLNNPIGAAYDAAGNLYISDNANQRIRKVNSTGIITTIMGNSSAGYTGDGGVDTLAQLNNPRGMAFDVSGNMYIADAGNNCIRKISPNHIVTTIAGNGQSGFSGDGGLAVAAQLNYPSSVAADVFGNIYIADLNNQRIRKIDASGIITTYAGTGVQGYNGDTIQAVTAKLNNPMGIAVDAAGNLFIADEYSHRVRKVEKTTGLIVTVAGTGVWGYSGDNGVASKALLNAPYALTIDQAGNIYIAEYSNQRIRKIDANNIITTFCGSGFPAFGGDGGPAISAFINEPTGLAVDPTGNVCIVDNGNDRVRKVSVPPSCTISANPGNDVCGSIPVTFTAAATNPGSSPIWQWYKNGVLLSGVTGNSYTTNALVTGDSIYCSLLSSVPGFNTTPVYSNHVYMTVKPTPLPPVITGTSAVCAGGTFGLNALSSSSGITYAWSGPNGFSATTHNFTITSAQVANSGSYTAWVIYSSNNCSSTPVSFNVTVNPITIPSVNITGNNVVCPNTQITLYANSNVSGVDYQWRLNGNAIGNNIDYYSFIPTNGANVTCEVTMPVNGCFSATTATSSAFTVSVPVSIPLTANMYGDSAVCSGQLALDSVTTVATGASFEWFVNGNSIGLGISKYTYNPGSSGTVSCTVAVPASSCYTPHSIQTATLPMATIVLPPSISLSANSVAIGSNVAVTATLINPGNNYIIKWIKNGITIGTTTTDTYNYVKTVAKDTLRAIIYTHTGSCYDTSISSDIYITAPTGIQSVASSLDIQIYPNPVTDNFYVKGLAEGDKLVLFDMLGRLVYQYTNSNSAESTATIHCAELIASSYVVRIVDKEGTLRYAAPIVKR